MDETKPIAVDLDAAADESAGVVSTERVAEPVIPPSPDPTPTSVEDLFRAGEEERAAQEQEQEAAPEADDEVTAADLEPAGHKEEGQPVVPESAPQQEQAAPAKEAQPPEEIDANDISDERPGPPDEDDDIPIDMKINSILYGKLDEALEEIRATYKTAKEFDAAQNDPTSILSKYMTTALHGWPTGKKNFLTDVLEHNDKVGDKLVRQSEAGIKPIVDGRPSAVRHHGANLSGKEAAMVLQNCLGGLHRVCLLNSGFWVVLRPPGMDELNELFNTIDAEGKELGRSLGAHFALISDMYLKKKFLEMLIKRRIIIESNFSGIYEKNAFEKVLSFHDYDALMHAVLSIGARKGLRMQMYCPQCHHESEEVLMDLPSCKFIDRSLMTSDMIAHWNKTRDANGNRIMHSADDLIRYRSMHPVQTQTITQTVNTGYGEIRVEMDLSVPTFSKYFLVGTRLLTTLTQTMNNIAKGNEDKTELIKDSLEIHGYQLIAPWIKTLRVYDPKDAKEPTLVTDDTEVILDYLDGVVQDDQTLDTIEVLNDFISKTRITYIGTFSLECPHCHAKPETGGINFYPMDVHTIFFGLCFRLLRKA